MSVLPRPDECVDDFLRLALAGQRDSAVRLAVDLRDRGIPTGDIIDGLLARTQTEVGERWLRGETNIAEEHVTTATSTEALLTLVSERHPVAAARGTGHTVAVAAEGDRHGLVPEMFGCWLRSLGIPVTVLGASMPADAVGQYLDQHRPDALAVSCSMPIFFLGVVRMVDAAHARGVPVMVGGRAFGEEGRWVERLGADAWAPSAADAVPILDAWRDEPPATSCVPVDVDRAVIALASRARDHAEAVVTRLGTDRPGRLSGTERSRWAHDVELATSFVASSLLVDDSAVFVQFVDWMSTWMTHRDLPVDDLREILATMIPVLEPVSPATRPVIEEGLRAL